MCNATTKPQRSKLLWAILKSGIVRRETVERKRELCVRAESRRFIYRCYSSIISFFLIYTVLKSGVGVKHISWPAQKLSLKNGGKRLWRCLRYGEWR